MNISFGSTPSGTATKAPLTTTQSCPHCGQQVFSRSMKFHVKACEKKMRAQRENLDPGLLKARCVEVSNDGASGSTRRPVNIGGNSSGGSGLVGCQVCGRTFMPDRIEKHVQVCLAEKQKSKKRQRFDSAKKRLGELENELKKKLENISGI